MGRATAHNSTAYRQTVRFQSTLAGISLMVEGRILAVKGNPLTRAYQDRCAAGASAAGGRRQ